MNEGMRKKLSRTLDAELDCLRISSVQKDALFMNAKGEKRMKKKISFSLVTAIVLTVILAGAALAATGAFDELMALLNSSFERMNTRDLVDVIDETDVPAYLEQFEKEYGGRKEDLVLSTVPGENDLSLDAALQIARNTIFDSFATPTEELDAMGVYPVFYATPYMDRSSEWQFYFTARRDEDLNEDHYFPAPGEYRVYIDSPSGEVTFCNWYNDEFWPVYAKRTWDAGKRDYVYEQAKKADFLRQSREDQAAFVVLFAGAGYDVSGFDRSAEELLRAMELELNTMDMEKDLMNSGDALVSLALSEMEKRYGLSKADLENCCYIACMSIYPAETKDICFAYNWNIEYEMSLAECENIGISYASRLGLYMIRIDPATLSVASTVHIPRTEAWEKADDPEKLLGRREWTHDDLPEFFRMQAELHDLDEQYRTGLITRSAMLNARDLLMLFYGGDDTIYRANHTKDEDVMTLARWLYMNDLTEDMIRQAGMDYIAAYTACTRERMQDASFIIGTQFDDQEHPETSTHHPTLLVILEEGGERTEWYMHFDMDLNVTEYTEQEGTPGANG